MNSFILFEEEKKQFFNTTTCKCVKLLKINKISEGHQVNILGQNNVRISCSP